MRKDRAGGVVGGRMEFSPEEMRRLGYRVVDEVVERWQALGEGPPWKGGTRRHLEPLLGGDPPEFGVGVEAALERAVREVLPWAGRIDHPRFFAFIPSSPTWPSVLGEYLATGFNVFQGTWLESAGPSQLELVVVDWFRRWLGFPVTGGGLLTSGGSAANLVALVTAREAAGNPPNPTFYFSDQGHSSLERAARIIGIPVENVRRVPSDAAFRMDLNALANILKEDRATGKAPLCICGNAGATNTGVIDPLREMGTLARDEALWFHIDGAYGGFAVLTEEGKDAMGGIEMADSVTLDPHKWFFQPYESGCLMVRDTRVLESAFRILPEYLQDVALGEEHVNFADRGIQLTRRFRALGIWMSVQALGVDAFREAIRHGVELARRAEAAVQESTSLELLAPSSLGILCFRFNPPGRNLARDRLEALNQAIQDSIVADGVAMISSTRLRGDFSLRLAILNYRSRWEDVAETLKAIEETGEMMVGGQEP